MPEQLLASEPADPDHDDQEQETGRGETIDMTALWVSRDSRKEVEALGFTAEQLRRITDVFTTAGDEARARMTKQAHPEDTVAPCRSREDDQRAFPATWPARWAGSRPLSAGPVSCTRPGGAQECLAPAQR